MVKARKARPGRPLTARPRIKRASVSLTPETYELIEALARQKRVSTSWVLRDAAEKYVADQWPLLGAGGEVTNPGGLFRKTQ